MRRQFASTSDKLKQPHHFSRCQSAAAAVRSAVSLKLKLRYIISFRNSEFFGVQLSNLYSQTNITRRSGNTANRCLHKIR